MAEANCFGLGAQTAPQLQKVFRELRFFLTLVAPDGVGLLVVSLKGDSITEGFVETFKQVRRDRLPSTCGRLPRICGEAVGQARALPEACLPPDETASSL